MVIVADIAVSAKRADFEQVAVTLGRDGHRPAICGGSPQLRWDRVVAVVSFIPNAANLSGRYFGIKSPRVSVTIVSSVKAQNFGHLRAPVKRANAKPAARHGTANGIEAVLAAVIKKAAAIAVDITGARHRRGDVVR
jgi:hypothetical protein